MRHYVTLFLLCSSFISLAQTKGKTELGINIGYNAARVQAGQYSNSATRSGLNAGITGDYYFSDRWSIKVKLRYDQKGWARGFITNETGATITTNYQLNYITVPLMANWHFGKKRNWYLNFGPYVGFLMSAKETALHSDLKEAFRSTDAGFEIGIGVKIPLSEKARFVIEYGGQGGLSEIFRINNSTRVISNMVVNLDVGVNISL